MSLLTDFADNVSSVVFDDWGETVTVFGLPGGDRSVSAVVRREQAAIEDGQAHKTRNWECSVHFVDDATNGSSATGVGYHEVRELEQNGRQWSIRIPGDDNTERWDFQELLSQDGGMVTCRFRNTARKATGQLTPIDL